MTEVKIPKVERIESFEGDGEQGVIYIDVHHKVIEYGAVGAENRYEAEPTYYGKVNLKTAQGERLFKFKIQAKSLKQAVKKFDHAFEESFKELREQESKRQIIVDPSDDGLKL